jgi:hypothetical protein
VTARPRGAPSLLLLARRGEEERRRGGGEEPPGYAGASHNYYARIDAVRGETASARQTLI